MPVEVKRNKAFVKDVIIKRVKTTDALLAKIVAVHGIPLTKVEKALRYNVITIHDFALVTGRKTNNIHQKIRGYARQGKIHYPLNICDPFDSLYLKFVYRNIKAEKMIYESAGYAYDLVSNKKGDGTQEGKG